MPERRWDEVLNELGDRLFVRLVHERGTVVDYAVWYVAMIEGQPMEVVRSDSAHGRAHYDVLDWDGKSRKVWSREHLDLGEAMTEAIDDLHTNWARYRDDFLRRRP